MNIKFALAGNPNCGKTTMFNALTGANQYVGNWPGVTVEKKEGKVKGNKEDNITVVDLPGIYSLSPYTLEEVVSRDFLLNEDPDVIIDLVDATNIERNLYLTTQLIETGVPVVIALNMADLIEKRGLKIDTKRLSMVLGCPIIETSALKGTGLKELIAEAVKVAKQGEHQLPQSIFSEKIEKAIDTVVPALSETITANKKRWYAVKVLENDEKVMNHIVLSSQNKTTIDSLRKELETELDDDMESIITDGRYTYIQKLISTTVEKPKEKLTMSDKIDKIVTNRFLGIPIFLAVMFVVYYISVTTIGTFVTDWTNDVFVVAIQDAVSGFLGSVGASSLLTAVIVDGIIGGVGAVIGFAPQMAILFLFLSILEDCGYMVRIAFVMDRVFRYFGLSGKSFIPLLIGSGCGIPAIMASKTIEQDNDRRLTIMTATFIPCGAKLPVIALLGGVMAGKVAGWQAAGFIAPAMYFVGIAAVLVAAIMLKKTKPFSGKPAPFVMELPAYHMPTVENVLRSMWERGWSFIKKAGTIILLSTILVWFTTYFGFVDGAFTMLTEDQIDYSILATIGKAISWIFAPLGWGNWQATVASITGLVAKENIVGTLGILYGAGDGSVYQNMAQKFIPISGYSFLVFNLLCAPCFAAMGAIKREMNNAKWTAFAIGYQCVFAYAIALVIYQIGLLVTGSVNVIGLIFAIAIIAFICYMLFKPYKESNTLKTQRSVSA